MNANNKLVNRSCCPSCCCCYGKSKTQCQQSDGFWWWWSFTFFSVAVWSACQKLNPSAFRKLSWPPPPSRPPVSQFYVSLSSLSSHSFRPLPPPHKLLKRCQAVQIGKLKPSASETAAVAAAHQKNAKSVFFLVKFNINSRSSAAQISRNANTEKEKLNSLSSTRKGCCCSL